MFHLRVFSIGVHKKYKPNHYLLLLAIDLEMTYFWSVNYICLVYKLKFFSTYWRSWKLFGCSFFDEKIFKILYLFSFYQKTTELVLKTSITQVAGLTKLPNTSLSNAFNLLLTDL